MTISDGDPGAAGGDFPDWALWGRALGACEAAGLEPVVDLLHVGLPDHAGGFAEPGWVTAFVPVARDDPGDGVLDEMRRRRALSWLVRDLHLGLDPLPDAAGSR
ncbi:MAG: hypothetical protein IPM45_14920 [Acidimicrobiales bacterium]|nr:hypothetical protein [Acidimicrobiales bacterium]